MKFAQIARRDTEIRAIQMGVSGGLHREQPKPFLWTGLSSQGPPRHPSSSDIALHDRKKDSQRRLVAAVQSSSIRSPNGNHPS